MRGQAFVVFEEISAATAAMRALVGEEFYGRPLVSAGSDVHWCQAARWESGVRGLRIAGTGEALRRKSGKNEGAAAVKNTAYRGRSYRCFSYS